MTKHFRSRYPSYPDDSDYQTNAPSYYDDLARKNKLIEILAEKIYGYEKVLAENLAEIERVLNAVIDKIGEGFNQEIVELLEQWILDGTLDHIINETLMNKKADKTELQALDDRLSQEIADYIEGNDERIDEFERVTNEKINTLGEEVLSEVTAISTKLTDDLDTSVYHAGITYEKLFDTKSQTSYVLTDIPMKDKQTGKVKTLKLWGDESNPMTGEEFLKENENVSFLANCGGHMDYISIIDEVVKLDKPSENPKRHTLGIKKDGTLKSYPPSSRASELIADNVVNALTSFVPLIIDYELQHSNFVDDTHPRQIIGQKENKDLIFLSTGGRGVGGDGMSYERTAEILQTRGVKFAYALDGGGSTQTFVRNVMVNENTNNKYGFHVGEELRERASFLYIENDKEEIKDDSIKEVSRDIAQLKREFDVFKGVNNLKWTPEILIERDFDDTIKYSRQEGRMVKLGDLVFNFFDISVSSKGTGVGSISISGSEYLANEAMSSYFSGNVTVEGFIPTVPINQVYLPIDKGKRYGTLRYINGETGKVRMVSNELLEESYRISGLMIYVSRPKDIFGYSGD